MDTDCNRNDTSKKWLSRLYDSIKKNQIVLRASCITSESYLKHLQQIRSWENPKAKISQEVLAIIKENKKTFYG